MYDVWWGKAGAGRENAWGGVGVGEREREIMRGDKSAVISTQIYNDDYLLY